MRQQPFGLVLGLWIGIATSASADPATRALRFSKVRFVQYDWLSVNPQLRTNNSLWGAVSLSYPDTTLGVRFLNLVAAAGPPPAQPAWVIQNMPIFPDAGRRRQKELAFFDLSELGLVEGQPLQQACWVMSLSFDDQADPPQAPPKCDPPRHEPYGLGHANGGTNGNPPQAPQPGAPNPIKHPAGQRAEKLGVNRPKTQYFGVEEHPQQCMAGAMARSLDWLNRAYKLGKKLSVAAILKDLVNEGVTLPPQGTETVPAAEGRRVGAKKAYTDKCFGAGKIITKTWDAGDKIDTPAGMTESAEPFDTWLRREWETEAVELAYEEPGGQHIITVIELNVGADGNFGLRYRDDSQQDTPNGGDKEPKRAQLLKVGADWFFSRGGRKIHFAVSESVAPPPPPE